MAPKKKKEKKGKKKKKEEKPPRMKKSEYLQIIAEKNAILAQARSKIKGVEDVYLDEEKRYDQLQEDMADIIKYLEHEIEENEEEIMAFDEKINEYTNEINKNDKYYESIFAKMANEFEEKSKGIKNQIQLASAKLIASDEIKQQREEYLRKREELYCKLQEMEERHEDEIYNAEKSAIIKQDTMQKDMEIHLTTLAKDFRQATDIAIGETTNKVIRDNIKLGNMLTCMQEIIEKARDSYQKIRDVEKSYIYYADLLDDEHYTVLQKYSKRVNKIETILKSHEELSERISMSKRLVKENRRLQRQITEKECILKEKTKELEDLTKILNENVDASRFVKDNFNALRANVVKLEYSLFEVAKKVKEGINVEFIKRLEEKDEEIPVEIDKEEQEENFKELRYKMRDAIIDEIIEKLSKGLRTDTEAQLIAPSSDSYLTSFHESTSSYFGPNRSSDVYVTKQSVH